MSLSHVFVPIADHLVYWSRGEPCAELFGQCPVRLSSLARSSEGVHVWTRTVELPAPSQARRSVKNLSMGVANASCVDLSP